jgi:hypothetical protein
LGEQTSTEILKWFPQSQTAFKNLPHFKSTFPQLYWDTRLYEKVMSNAWMDATKEINKRSFEEILTLREENPKSFLFYNKDYYAPTYSSQLIGRLLLEQNNNDLNQCRQFINTVWQIINKVHPKRNTLLINSPPSSGKTFFVNTILELLNPSVGKIRNPKKNGDSFCFQDAVNCRINEWNECLLDGKEFIETAKTIWEGNNTPVNVKYLKGQQLERTPLIVTCNGWPWRHHPGETKAFQDRCFDYQWERQEWLKNVQMYPTPLMWRIILSEFHKDEWWHSIPGKDYFDDDKAKILFDKQEYELYFDTYCEQFC